MATRNTPYFGTFAEILHTATQPIDFDVLCTRFQASPNTVKRYLKAFMEANPSTVGRVIGVYPSAETVIGIAEAALGSIDGSNVVEINKKCKSIIDSITKPKHAQFITENLRNVIGVNDDINISKDQLIDFLFDSYIDFVHESDNGLVSIAGTMNEQILLLGLKRAGLVLGEDFRKTGTNSEADLQVEYRGPRVTKILHCEVKSYAARERLLRGLQDIKAAEKIAIGFFNNASEFNPSRTQTLLQAQPLAIYMPDDTLERVSEESKSQLTAKQDKLYRPISMFFNDMKHFKIRGELPQFN